MYTHIFISHFLNFFLFVLHQGPPGPPGPPGPAGEKVRASEYSEPYHCTAIIITIMRFDENQSSFCVKTLLFAVLTEWIFALFVSCQGELGLPGPAGVDGEKVWLQRGRNYAQLVLTVRCYHLIDRCSIYSGQKSFFLFLCHSLCWMWHPWLFCLQGPKGDMGETGPPGERGEKGEMGLSGPSVSSDSKHVSLIYKQWKIYKQVEVHLALCGSGYGWT